MVTTHDKLMKILSIETSCDETAVSILNFNEIDNKISFDILSNELYSQVEKHIKYGGVYPTLAKREHTLNLPILCFKSLTTAKLLKDSKSQIWSDEKIKNKELLTNIKKLFKNKTIESLDAIAITVGPGLSPALWVGVEFANILSETYKIPLIPVNHMEGHILSSYIKKNNIEIPKLPILSLLISGGHTEFVIQEKFRVYEKIGQTLDDSIGETFDKVGRLIGLDYPGGPKISKYAAIGKKLNLESIPFPQPLSKRDTLDFSFSGLKTAVRYYIDKNPITGIEQKYQIAMSFEDTVVEVISKKVKLAFKKYPFSSFVVGGGVTANISIRNALKNICNENNVQIYLPEISLSTDNSIMIGISGYINKNKKTFENLTAKPNLTF